MRCVAQGAVVSGSPIEYPVEGRERPDTVWVCEGTEEAQGAGVLPGGNKEKAEGAGGSHGNNPPRGMC